MNAALLRILVTAAARSAERGTLFEIIATAEKLITLVKPLLAEGEADGQVAASSIEPGSR